VSTDVDRSREPTAGSRPRADPGSEGDRDADAPAEDASVDAPAEDAVGEGFGPYGWLLVGVVVATTLVVPGIIYLLPRLLGRVGLPYVVALLILPMVPAVVLGLTAVWTMAASNHK
jgi:hypothetical protein